MTYADAKCLHQLNKQKKTYSLDRIASGRVERRTTGAREHGELLLQAVPDGSARLGQLLVLLVAHNQHRDTRGQAAVAQDIVQVLGNILA